VKKKAKIDDNDRLDAVDHFVTGFGDVLDHCQREVGFERVRPDRLRL
jgi:hypothetical protein